MLFGFFKLISILAFILIAGGVCAVSITGEQTAIKQEPEINYVPDSATAVKIAEAIWLPLYGNDIYKQKPYLVSLKKGIWIVEGRKEEDSFGGTAYIEFQKKDCKILKVTHGL